VGRTRNFAPELAPAAQGFLAQLQRLLIPAGETVTAIGTTRTMSEGDSLKRTNKEEGYEALITELEDTADKESNLAFRRVAYIQAAVATRPEDYLRAKRIAEKIDDADLRADGISFVLYRAALFFVGKEDPEKAIELIPQITDGTRRAVARIATVQRLLTVNNQHAADQQALRFNQQRAFDLLANVDLDLKNAEPSATVAKIRLAQSALWAQFDSAQALVALEHAALILNKLENFNVRDARAPDLGLAVFAASGATVPTPRLGYDLRGAIEPLITTDFDQALAILSRLTAKDVSGMARMELAKLFLQKTALSPGRSAAEVRKLTALRLF
jgi:hypothetical protein